jgi:hypothetical protein
MTSFELVYPSSQTYNENLKAGTVRIKLHSNQVSVRYRVDGLGKSAASFAMSKDDAVRVARGILLASSTENTPIEFPFGETEKK